MATLPSQTSPARPQVAAPPQVAPTHFFESVNSYQRTAALKAAVELELFTAIGEGAHSSEAIALRCQCSQRGARMLCDYLVIAGWLTKHDARYELTPEAAAFLDRKSGSYLGGCLKFLLDSRLQEGFNLLAESVRRGGAVIENGRGTLVEDNPLWVEFAESMAPMMVMPAEFIAELLGARAGKAWKVLDVAAGHGVYGITLARHNPNAQIVAVDWPSVLEVAKRNARTAGVSGRHQRLPGSAFEVEYGNGYDVALVTNFCHHFDVPTNEQLLKKIHAALKPGGRVVILEFIPNEDRVTPAPAAAFSLIMLVGTPHGDAYTFSEYQRMLAKAGFATAELHDMPSPDHRVVIATK